jgi:hypothetical protein
MFAATIMLNIEIIMPLIKMHESCFDCFTWRSGAGSNLGVPHRKEMILAIRHSIRAWAVGWTEGYCLLCRPKVKTIAVMFVRDTERWWTHLMEDEFDIIFPNLRKPYRYFRCRAKGEGK